MSSKRDVFAPDEGYRVFLEEIKQNIQSAQIKAALSVNRCLLELYLSIGDKILLKQEQEQWGKSVVERLSTDLKKSFPHLKGFSPRNLWDMRRLSESVRGNQILRQVVAEIPWGHNLVLLNKIKNIQERVTAEYALRDMNKPIGVAQWQAQITKSLPEPLQTELPTIEELEAELEAVSVEVEEG